MSEKPELKSILEALLLAADEPLPMTRILSVFAEDEEQPDKKAIKAALEELQADYAERAMDCVELASGYTFRVKQGYAHWVAKLWEMKPARYSRAYLETLALIAYKQPVTRSEIEQVRGVAVNSHIIKTLLERDWVKIVGHRDVPGKPALLATTPAFLDYFNLKSLEELPSLAEVCDLEQAGSQLEMQLQQVLADETGAAGPAEEATESEEHQSAENDESIEDNVSEDSTISENEILEETVDVNDAESESNESTDTEAAS